MRSTVFARLAFACKPDLITFVHTSRNLYIERLGMLDATLAVTGRTWVGDDLTCTATGGACLLDREETLLHSNLAVAAAGAAHRGGATRLGTAAFTPATGFKRRYPDADLCTPHGVFERQFQAVAKIGTAKYILPSP